MRDFLKEGKLAQQTNTEKKGQISPAKLQVAFVNRTLIKAAEQNNSNRVRESVFSTTNGSYYINGIPAILSQDEEAMLADYYECSEYY
jgi:hypothetical protein